MKVKRPTDPAHICSIRQVVNSGKICVLNLQVCNFQKLSKSSEFVFNLTFFQPTSLPAFHESDLKPYVVFLTPSSPQVYNFSMDDFSNIFFAIHTDAQHIIAFITLRLWSIASGQESKLTLSIWLIRFKSASLVACGTIWSKNCENHEKCKSTQSPNLWKV